MRLSEVGEKRVYGYLFVLGRSLRSFLPEAVAVDALREIEGHIRERVEEVEPEPDERQALERLLTHLGSPLRVAQAYSGELAIEEAVATGRIGPTARALWHVATSTILGFFPALGLLFGYLLGFSCFVIALVKPILPSNTGLLLVDGAPRAFGVVGSLPEGGEIVGGYWIIPILLALGLLVLAATQRGTLRFLDWWRERTAARRLAG